MLQAASPESAVSPAGITPTFFRVRNITSDLTFQNTQMYYHQFHNQQSCWGDLYIRPFYQRTFNGSAAAGYFLPSGSDRVQLNSAGAGDINPTWLNLVAPTEDPQSGYFSTVSINPVRSTYGALISLNLFPFEYGFFTLHFAALHASHNLHLQETARGEDITADLMPETFCQAMNSADLEAGLIPCQKVCAGGVDDIKLQLGYDLLRYEVSRCAGYVVCFIPTGPKHLYTSVENAVLPASGDLKPTQGSQFLFQPLVGSRQWSIGAGLSGETVLLHAEDESLWLLADGMFNFYTSATERRYFDLQQNGNWSRYLLVVPSTARLNTSSGINDFTFDVKVRPGVQVQLWTALHYERARWQVEGGYSLWYRQEERLKIPDSATLSSDIGIFDIPGVLAANPVSASTATINLGVTQIESDATFVALTKSMLNPNSAIHPQTASSTFFGSLARDFELSEWVIGHLGLNGSVEFAHNRAAFDQYALWLTAALLF